MNTAEMTDEEYSQVIYTKEEIEKAYKIFKSSAVLETNQDYIDYAIENNKYRMKIENYDILKRSKSDSLINNKRLKKLRR